MLVKDPRTFYAEYVAFGRTQEDAISRGALIADGRVVVDKGPTRWTKPVDVARKRLLPANVAAAWFLQFPKLIFAGIGGPEAPFTRMVASAPRAGLVVEAQRRAITFGGQRFLQHRFVIRRAPAASRRLGPYQSEIVIDDRWFLPMIVRESAKPPGKAETVIAWRATWNLAKGQRFDPAKFRTRFGAR